MVHQYDDKDTPSAQYGLGWYYSNGTGVSSRLQTSGLLVHQGVRTRIRKRTVWLKLTVIVMEPASLKIINKRSTGTPTAEQRIAEAQYGLGQCYRNGKGFFKITNKLSHGSRKPPNKDSQTHNII